LRTVANNTVRFKGGVHAALLAALVTAAGAAPAPAPDKPKPPAVSATLQKQLKK